MAREGSVYRRCTGCRRTVRGRDCPCGHGRTSWTFVVDVSTPGARKRRQLRRGGFKRKQDAVEAMHAELVDRRRGMHLEPSDVTFGEYSKAWLHGRASSRVKLGRLAETTWAIYERDLRNHLLPALADVPLQGLDSHTLTSLYTAMADHLASSTIANIHGLAHRILEDAVNDGLLDVNPAGRAVKPRIRDTEQPTWTPEQVARFLGHVHDQDLDWHALFALIATTGIRRGEAIGLTWAAVNLDIPAIEVRQSITKAGSRIVVKEPKSRRSRRIIPLSEQVLELLRAHRERQDARRAELAEIWQDDDLVFPNELGRYRYPDYVSTRFALYAESAGLPHIGGPHGLRHSLASALDANGKGLATISAILGHASTAVTSKVYTHMLEGVDRTALQGHAVRIFGPHSPLSQDS